MVLKIRKQLTFIEELNTNEHQIPTKTLLVVYPGTLFWIAEQTYGDEIAHILQMNILATLQEWSGNIIVIENRWWKEQDEDFRDAIEEILVESIARGCLGRRYLEHEEPEMFPEWKPIQYDRKDFVFDEVDDTIYRHIGELVDGTDITITGGWLTHDIRFSVLDSVATSLRDYCPRSAIEIARDAFDQDISGEEYLCRTAYGS